MHPRLQFLEPLRGMAPLLKWAAYGLGALILLIIISGRWLDGLTQAPSLQGPPALKGMALGLYYQESEYDYATDLDEMKALGVNSVLLMIPWYQEDIFSNKMKPRYLWGQGNTTFPDQRLEGLILKAHERDLKVMLMPYLRFEKRKPKEWRGVLKPKNFSEWAKNYQGFILHYADLAQRTQVEFFSVGSELGSMETKREFWLDLIQRVRNKFSGKLLYSANWDHYTHPVFWEKLDFIGITSYHRLTLKTPPTLGEIRLAWDGIKKKILAFQKKYPAQKIIFTEVGYPSQEGAAKDPWNYFTKAPVDLEEQALCYQAFMEAWDGSPALEGIFWWVWFGKGGPRDPSYTPRGKPAEAWLRKWYKAMK